MVSKNKFAPKYKEHEKEKEKGHLKTNWWLQVRLEDESWFFA